MHRFRFPTRFVALLALLASVGVHPAVGQDKPPVNSEKEDEEVLKLQQKDPFTQGDPALMAAAGVVGYGPFPWADHKTTTDVDRVLGEKRVLWVETKHFRVGFALRTCPLPEDQAQKKELYEELKELRKKLPKIPDRPKRLEPWVRLHLYLQRLEKGYADIQELLGVTDADFPARGKEPRQGAYLGMPDKYLVTLFQKKSDLARMVDRFCGGKDDTSFRYYHAATHQMYFGCAAEGLEGFDDYGLYGHTLYAVTHNLLNGYNGYYYSLPLWLDEGIAHWYSRKVPSKVVNVQIQDHEAVAEDKQNDWPQKIRKRAQHDGATLPFAKMAAWEKFDELGFHGHAQAWSRVDFLMQRDAEKLGAMVKKLKDLPVPVGGQKPPAEVAAVAQKLLAELYELDAESFDQKWREWVLKTYPKK